MAGIIGLTDNAKLRHDGKIRAGKKNDKGHPQNSPHFLLHEVPDLINTLGDEPTEIYFTVPADHPDHYFQPDLRWYTKSELVCRSMHNHIDPFTQQSMGSVAAFFRPGQDVQGLTADKFPGMRAFVRRCGYKACPDYVRSNCGEHFTLDMYIPQHSMGHIFRLESTSIYGLINIMDTFKKAWNVYDGKMAGQIFRLFKKKDKISFPDDKGGSVRRETELVSMENVSFEDYEKNFRDKISDSNWEALLRIRNRTGFGMFMPGPSTIQQLQEAPAPVAAALPESPMHQADAASGEDAVLARANDPVIAPLFAEIALLLDKENSEANRISTAKQFPDTQRLHDYLKKRIKDMKKAQAAPKEAPRQTVASKVPPKAPPKAATPVTPPPTAAPQGEVIDQNPLY